MLSKTLDALGYLAELEFLSTPCIGNLDICFRAPAEAVWKREDALPSWNQVVQGVVPISLQLATYSDPFPCLRGSKMKAVAHAWENGITYKGT